VRLISLRPRPGRLGRSPLGEPQFPAEVTAQP